MMTSHPLATRRAFAAVILLFAYNGVVVGVYAASIPILRDRFGLSPIHMSVLFIVTGIAAIASMQVAGRLADRYGARRVCLVTILPLMIAAVGYALAPSYAFLLATGVFLGAGNGGLDVSMNALAVQVEQRRTRPVMSFFHAMWAIGSFSGGLAVSLVGTVIGLAPRATVATCALTAAGLGIVALVTAWRITPETQAVTHVTATGAKTKIPPAAYLMGVMAIAFGLGEGTAADWSGQHVMTVAGVDPRTAAWAVTAVSGCMVVIRLTGDWLARVWGRRRLVRFGGTCSALGYLICAFATPFPVLIAGWALVGLGIGVIAPQVYASAGYTAGGRGLAVVASFGYATFLMGPALIGGLVSAIGIQHTMAVPGVLLLGLIPLAGIAVTNDIGTADDTAAGAAPPLE